MWSLLLLLLLSWPQSSCRCGKSFLLSAACCACLVEEVGGVWGSSSPLAPAWGCGLGVMLVVWLLPGSGRVTFNNQRSYLKAVTAAFVEIKTTKFTKKVRSWRERLWGSPGSWSGVCVMGDAAGNTLTSTACPVPL